MMLSSGHASHFEGVTKKRVWFISIWALKCKRNRLYSQCLLVGRVYFKKIHVHLYMFLILNICIHMQENEAFHVDVSV